MKENILLGKISDTLRETCHVNNIKRVNDLTVVVNYKSHLNEKNLLQHLKNTNNGLIGNWTRINVHKDKILDQTAILHSIQGEEYD